MDKDKVYILHIMDEIESIGKFIGNMPFEMFLKDEKTAQT